MKTKLFIVVLLTVISVLVVSSAVSGAVPLGTESTHPRRPSDDYSVYLPLVVKPDCSPRVTAYVSAMPPVVRAGDTMTLTGAIVNECSPLVGEPQFSAYTDPQGILSATIPVAIGYYSVPVGEYRELTLTLQAVSTGSVTITSGMYYETLNDDVPPGYYWRPVAARPIVVRVLPPYP